MSIVEQLNQWTAPDLLCPAAREKQRVLAPMLEAVARGFSPGFLDELLSAQVEVEAAECEAAFCRGFRLGAQLTMETFGPAMEKGAPWLP